MIPSVLRSPGSVSATDLLSMSMIEWRMIDDNPISDKLQAAPIKYDRLLACRGSVAYIETKASTG